MIPSAPRTLGGTSFRQVVKAGKCGYRMAIFFVECKCRFRRHIGCKTRNPHAAGGGKDSARGAAEFGGAALGPVFRHCPRGWSQYLQRMGPPLRRGFRAAACADPLHESALGYIQSYRAIFRVDPQILQVSFADERLELLKGIAGRRGRFRAAQRSGFPPSAGAALPRCGARRPCGMRGEECERSASRARRI